MLLLEGVLWQLGVQKVKFHLIGHLKKDYAVPVSRVAIVSSPFHCNHFIGMLALCGKFIGRIHRIGPVDIIDKDKAIP